MKLSVVVPLLNENESLSPLMEAIDAALARAGIIYEVVFVDDGSTDGSFRTLSALASRYPGRVRALRFGRNYGKAAALSVGIEAAAGDVIVTMDADLQDDPEVIPDMVKLLDSGWDVVSGWKKKRYDPITKTLPSKLWNFTTSLVAGVKLHDFNCGFKAYRAEAAKSLEIYGERHRYLPVLAAWNGYRITEMVVPHHPRKFGKSKYGFGRGLKGIFDLLTLLFLRKYIRNPLHFFGLVGVLLALLGSLVIAYFGVEWIVTRQMHIRPLVLLSMGAIIMGIQFISIGLIGEMITHSAPKSVYRVKERL
ncbi:MAG TPA: glycosyltransferase family 2 protein [Chitinivibrionales bacterium]|jgi:glycosyltransferase involved in cell wall biosynthesis|nr:glycosyltransferase family 2 protein [Chitinivibrionales bacterium]